MHIELLDSNYNYWSCGALIRNQDMLTAAINLKLPVTRQHLETGRTEKYEYQAGRGRWVKCSQIACTMSQL